MSAKAMDFSRRAYLSELMDQPCTYGELRDCLRDLERVNKVTFAYRPTLLWLQHLARTSSGSRPLHIVDVGSGGGDMLRRLERWGNSRQIELKLTGIDLNPFAVQAAKRKTTKNSRIRWIAGNAYSFDHISEPIDAVISSLFTHHLEDAEIARFLGWMESVSQRGWFINDLSRGPKSYFAFKALAAIFNWHHFVKHDGPVSIRRAFQREDWERYAQDAGLPLDVLRIESRWPGRLTVARFK